MKRKAAIPLAIAAVLALAGVGGGFFLYSKGPHNTYASALVAAGVTDKTVKWYKEGFDRYDGVFLPGTTINGTDASGMTPAEFTEYTIADNRKGSFTLTGLKKATEKIRINDMVGDVKLEKYIEKRDKLRQIYYKKYTGNDIGDAVLYTFTFDTSKVSIDACAKAVTDIIENK